MSEDQVDELSCVDEPNQVLAFPRSGVPVTEATLSDPVVDGNESTTVVELPEPDTVSEVGAAVLESEGEEAAESEGDAETEGSDGKDDVPFCVSDGEAPGDELASSVVVGKDAVKLEVTVKELKAQEPSELLEAVGAAVSRKVVDECADGVTLDSVPLPASGPEDGTAGAAVSDDVGSLEVVVT